MILNISRIFVALIAISSAGATVAQVTDNRVGAETDWNLFVETDPTQCWAVSAPKETVNTRDGDVVTVRRGDIRLIVFYQPAEDVAGQVMFAGGYPFASGSTVSVEIDGTEFQMFTEGETAWPATPEDDAKFVTAMKRGADAVITGRSGRGTTTKDTFSLLGFTAMVEEAERRCAE